MQMTDHEILLDDPNATIFKYVQTLLTMSSGANKAEKLKRIWEPTYTWVFNTIWPNI